MIAKMSMVQTTADLMRDLYGPWLDQNHGAGVETAYWTRWSHRKSGAAHLALAPEGAPGAATQPVAIR